MKARLIAQIRAENNKVQSSPSTDEPALIETGYERLQKLVWDLKQTGHNPTVMNRLWPLLVGIGNYELRKMRSHYSKTLDSQDVQAYVDGHRQVKDKINQAILPLFY